MRCPHCGGNLALEDGELRCLHCARLHEHAYGPREDVRGRVWLACVCGRDSDGTIRRFK